MQAQTAAIVASKSNQNVCVCGKANPTPCKATVLEPMQLNRVNLRTFIAEQYGKFVSVDYVKLDGGTRTLTGRLGVKKHLKGGTNNVEADSRPYLTMFDVQLRQYRTVKLDTVTAMRAAGRVYRIV